MRRRVHLAVVTFALLTVGACSDHAPTVPESANSPGRATLLDATSGGNPHFYFLRPIAPRNPSFSGTFHGNLYPTVEICYGTTQTANGHCADVLASFKLDGGYNNDGEVISTPNGEQMYKTQWHSGNYDVPLDQPLRVVVLLGNFVAGYVDVIKGTDGKFRDAETGTQISGNSTLPIKFRLERGVLCGQVIGCVEEKVGGNGGLIVLKQNNGKSAGADFPDGALNETVNFVIDELSESECLPTDLQQFRGCYHFYTEPSLAQFAEFVEVGLCVEQAGVGYYENGELRLWKWSETPGDALIELERITIDWLECPEPTLGSLTGSPLLRGLARAGRTAFAPLAWAVGPKRLYGSGYQGGKLSTFSRIGWVRPLDVEIVQGDNQTAAPGTVVPINPTVRVTNRYGESSAGVVGRTVNFTPSGDGSASPATTLSANNGQAATAWTLATTAGQNTLLARVQTSRSIAPAPYEAEVTFNANAVPRFTVKWLPPLVPKSNLTGTTAAGLAPVITVTKDGGETLATLSVSESNGQYSVNWNVPTLVVGAHYRLALMVHGIEQGHLLLVQVNDELRNVSTGLRVLNLRNSRTLPIKFVVYR